MCHLLNAAVITKYIKLPNKKQKKKSDRNIPSPTPSVLIFATIQCNFIVFQKIYREMLLCLCLVSYSIQLC